MRFFPAKQPGKKANDRTIDISVTGMTCQKCVEHITAALESLETVKRVSVLLRSNEPSQVTILTDYEIEDQTIRDTIKEA
ncbi:heavy metal-associated domain-containing protein, partial [Varibaculum cambriense]